MKNKSLFLIIFAVVALCGAAGCLYFVFATDPVSVGEEIEIFQSEIVATDVVDEESPIQDVESDLNQTVVQMKFGEGSYDFERLDFYSDYMVQPESFLCTYDYDKAIGYMLIHNISELSVWIENPGYYQQDIEGVVEEIMQSYSDLQLTLTPYIDLWSEISVSSVCEADESGLITEIRFTLELSNTLGMSTEEITSRVNTANAFCVVLIEQLYNTGYLSDDMEDKEKIYVIYSYLVNKVVYDYDTLEAMEDEDNTAFDSEARDFYTALVEKSSVCQGISSAMIQLCRMVDVPLYVQFGYAGGGAHSWCKYQLSDGSWVYFDPTWAINDYETTSYHPSYWCWVTQEFLEENTRDGREFWEGVTADE